MTPRHLYLAASALSLALAPHLAHAQETEGHSNASGDSLGEIVVAGHPPIDFGIINSTASLEGDALLMETRGQIGETLAKLPGVSATSFSPGASRPVLRGFDGDRIRVLTDGIGAIDASSVSADHAVVLDPLTTDHIDVIHGPAVLLFGGKAIGGAINALDKRIPRRVPDAPTGTVIGGYGSAADERSAAGTIDVPLGTRFVFHADAGWRKSDDLRIGGYVASPALRAELLDESRFHAALGETEEAAEFAELADRAGRLPSSSARTTTLGAGLAFIDAGGSLGVSIQRFDTLYGVPLRPGFGHAHAPSGGTPAAAHGEEDVAIDLVQTRVDLRGELKLSGLFQSLQLRAAFGEYEHVELEGDEIGTTFTSNGLEGRLDLVQADHGGWRGRSGVQFAARKLNAIGEEAVVPANDITNFGIFTLQSYRLGAIEFEAAGRFERASVSANGTGFQRDFDLWSGASGLSVTPISGVKIGINYVHGERAPAPEELLSDGPHIASQAYEIGDPAFGIERSNGFEAYLKWSGDNASLSVTGYITDFTGFITPMPTGAVEDDLPVYQFTQHDARFQGFEASASVTPLRWDGGSLTIDGSADYTHAQLKGIGPVPRIPPLRLQGGIEVKQGGLRLRGEVEWNDRQARVPAFDTPTAGFTVVNLSADWHPLGEDGPLTLFLSANNLFDVDARRAASPTRDFAPLAGRDIRVSAKLSF